MYFILLLVSFQGRMLLVRDKSSSLQELVHILKIDPENVRIANPDKEKDKEGGNAVRLVQNKLTAMKNFKVKTLTMPSIVAKKSPATTNKTTASSAATSKPMPLRVAAEKRRRSSNSGQDQQGTPQAKNPKQPRSEFRAD